jgi:hypothetical protein
MWLRLVSGSAAPFTDAWVDMPRNCGVAWEQFQRGYFCVGRQSPRLLLGVQSLVEFHWNNILYVSPRQLEQ